MSENVYIAVDANCPSCGWPERRFNPDTGEFGCTRRDYRCDYTSTSRDE